MKRKIVAVLLVVAMFSTLLGGCSNNTGKETNTGGDTPTKSAEGSGDGTSEGGKKTWPEGTTVTWYIRGGAADYNNYLYQDLKGIKAIEEATGIKIEFQVANAPSNDEINEQYALMIASGQYPDVIQYFHNEAYSGGIPKLYEEGVVLELNDLIDDYMPNFKKILDENPDIARDLKNDDGKYLYFTRINPLKSQEDILDASYFGLMMRQDWLDNVALEAPKNIDEWYQVLTAFKNQDPNGNGLQDEIPFDAGSSALSFFYPAFNILNGVYINPDTGKVAYGQASAEYKEFLATMNKWYSEGLIQNAFDSEGNALDSSLTDENIYANIAGSWKGLANYWEQRLPKLLEKNPNANFAAVPWPQTKEGKTYTPSTYFSYTNREQIIISPDCKNPEAVATLIDYMYSEEGSQYLTWGIEGESFTKDAEGKRQLTESAKEVVTYYDGNFPNIYTYAMAHIGFPRFGFNDFAANSREKTYIDSCVLWSQADHDLVYPSSIVLTPEEQEKAIGTTKELGEYISLMQAKFITGEEPLTNYDNYISTLKKMGMDALIEAYQQAYDRYQAR